MPRIGLDCRPATGAVRTSCARNQVLAKQMRATIAMFAVLRVMASLLQTSHISSLAAVNANSHPLQHSIGITITFHAGNTERIMQMAETMLLCLQRADPLAKQIHAARPRYCA